MKRTTSALYMIIAITLLVSFAAAWDNSKLTTPRGFTLAPRKITLFFQRVSRHRG